MIVKNIYKGTKSVQKICHNGEVINLSNPIVFQLVENDELTILGAYEVNDMPDGLYLDCSFTDVSFHEINNGKFVILGAYKTTRQPNALYIDCNPDWVYPVLNGNTLTVEQVYSTTLNGNTLEVE